MNKKPRKNYGFDSGYGRIIQKHILKAVTSKIIIKKWDITNHHNARRRLQSEGYTWSVNPGYILPPTLGPETGLPPSLYDFTVQLAFTSLNLKAVDTIGNYSK